MRNMCFWGGKTKAREVRAQEESADALGPGSLSVGVRSPTQSIMASMRSVGTYGWEGHGQKLQPHNHKQHHIPLVPIQCPSHFQVANT